MSGIRIGTTALALILLAGVSGAVRPARAQASGTLQASVTVIDDPVSRSVHAAAITALEERPELAPTGQPGASGSEPLLLALPGQEGVEASIIELAPVDGNRRVRVEVVHR